MGIQPGDEVYFSIHEGHVHVEKRRPSELLQEFLSSLPRSDPGQVLSQAGRKRARDEQYERRFPEDKR